MKKKWLVMMLAVSMLVLAACGKKDPQELKYLSDFKASDYVTLGEYKGLEISIKEPEVTEDYLEGYLGYLLQQNPVSTPITDRAVEMGDTVDINYVGKIDDVAFDGGTGQITDLVIGSGRFIEGFEDGVVGMNIGDVKDVEATFPEPYDNNPDLAGKKAVFTVTLNGIYTQEVPELTDEYVAGLGIEGCTNVEEFRAYNRDVLMEQQKESYEQEKTALVLEKAVANMEIKDAPSGMVERMTNTMISNITAYAGMYGADIGEYVATVYGGTAENYEETLRAQAADMAKQYLMLQTIADKEGLTIAEEELEEQLAGEAAEYGYEDAEAYKEAIDLEAYKEFLMTQKVLEFLAENAVVTAAE